MSTDTYAFLPGETGKVCGDRDSKQFPITWSNSGTSIQFKGPDGRTVSERPKCLWIDSPDSKLQTSTPTKGFQVHLPDFKLDNSRWKEWEDDTYHMCGSSARFGAYKALNEYSMQDQSGAIKLRANAKTHSVPSHLRQTARGRSTPTIARTLTLCPWRHAR